MPQTFTYELRDLYLTQQIALSAEGTTSVLVGEDFSTQRKITLTDDATAKIASSNSGSSLTEVSSRTDKHFEAEGKVELEGGLKWGFVPSGSLSVSGSVGGGYGRRSSRTENQTSGHRDEESIEMARAMAEQQSQTENQRIKKEQELITNFKSGNYLLRFSVVLRNRDSKDTLEVKGSKMRAYLTGPGLPGGISVPYSEGEEFSLGYGEKFCVFEYRITDQEQFKALLRLGNQGGLQRLSLKVSGADFPIKSEKTGQNILDEQAAWEKESCFVGIDFGRLAELSPWWVSRWHGEGTGKEG